MLKVKSKMQNFALIFGSFMFVTILSLNPLCNMAQANEGGYTGPKNNTGGYSGPGPAVVSIKDAGNKADDTWITLQGRIINHLGDDKYTFEDASGTGIVEIERKAWRGANVNANDTVKLLIKVDKDWGSTELEAKSVTVVAQ